MNYKFRHTLVVMAQPAHPTQEQIDKLIAGWNDYFMLLDIPENQEQDEFNAIMRVRAYCGSISLVAPDITLESGN